jgi:hypothetical protein
LGNGTISIGGYLENDKEQTSSTMLLWQMRYTALNDSTNKNNCRFWAEENSIGLHLVKMMAWYAVRVGFITGLYLFEDSQTVTVNSPHVAALFFFINCNRRTMCLKTCGFNKMIQWATLQEL